MRISLLHALTATLLVAGCAASGQVRYNAHVTTPELVYIDSDVQVIADYREPIFYTDGYYWRYDGGAWYRSSRYTSGWVRIEVVPVAIRRIERPGAYVHYRAGARAGTARGPAVRDHRDEHKEMKDAHKEERQDQKDARQDHKDDQKAAKRDHKHGR
jgi:hypothetical protein